MANKNNKNNIKDERIEDVTMYGEFISSFDQWMTPDRQRKVAGHLEEVTSELVPGVKNDKKRSE
jgi:hypothetical protein